MVAKARQFDAKDGVTDPESGSSASDDGMRLVLEDRKDDPVRAELAEAARAHNNRTARYLLEMPMLSNYLEEAHSKFGHSAEEFEELLW